MSRNPSRSTGTTRGSRTIHIFWYCTSILYVYLHALYWRLFPLNLRFLCPGVAGDYLRSCGAQRSGGGVGMPDSLFSATPECRGERVGPWLCGCTHFMHSHRPSHPYDAWTEYVGFSPTRKKSRAPSAKRRGVFSESPEG